ncbi:IMP dehydrogenase [Candidatus Woesebacteria bacterium]|nr:IMP dehydrogenase [Candidatus Woesebacteria bacterium]
MKNLTRPKADFEELRNPVKGKARIKEKLKKYEETMEDYLAPWYALSKENTHVYPSQGILLTPYDYLKYESLQLLPQEKLIQTLRMRWFFLEMFNHPYRAYFLKKINMAKFVPPPKVRSALFDHVLKTGLSLSIGDFGASVVGSQKPRVGRSERYAQGPFVKLGRQARSIFVGSASPDVWNASPAIATMAASHCLTTIPRNGVLSDIKRQADLAKESFDWLKKIDEHLLKGRTDKKPLFNMWKNNIGATIEANPEKSLNRAKALHKAGIRTFRIYSPEPGTEPVKTLKLLRKEFGTSIEIFVSHIIDVTQAKRCEEYGADGIYIGIGGGGRCITGVRSGSVIDWPSLLWLLRGEISIPVIVEGGGSDHVATTLLLGASGISVSRIVAGGTIESPGGALFCSNNGTLFKPYGGEASARTKYLESKLLPFEIPSFVEGETTTAEMSYVKHVQPTLTYNLHLLTEDAILAMVFRNASSLEELHSLDPSPLKQATTFDSFQRNTH